MALPNQNLISFVNEGRSFVFWVYVLFCFIVFGCQYQCSQLPLKPRLQNELLCVKWHAKPHSITQLLLCYSMRVYAAPPLSAMRSFRYRA